MEVRPVIIAVKPNTQDCGKREPKNRSIMINLMQERKEAVKPIMIETKTASKLRVFATPSGKPLTLLSRNVPI